MRNLNFLRKSERKSVGTTLALTVGSPSAHRRYSALKHLAFMLLFLLGSLNVWGETITFKTTTGTEGSSNITSSTNESNILTAGAEYIAFTNNCVKAYYPGKSGLKLGSGSATGTVAFTLSLSNITSITIKTAKYGKDTGTLTFKRGSTSLKTGQTPGSDIVQTFSPAITPGSDEFTIATSSKRAYISEIIVETSSDSSDPTLSAAPTTIDFGTVERDASVAAKTVAVTYANLTGSVTYSGLSDVFEATGTIANSGDEITITPSTGTIGNYSQTLTIQSSTDSKVAEVTVKMNVVAPFEGETLELKNTDFATSYTNANGDHNFGCVTITSNQVGNYSTSIQFQKNTGYLYNKTDLGEIAKIEITKTGNNNLDIYEGTEENPTTTKITGVADGNVTTYTFSSGKGFFRISCNNTAASNVTPIKVYYTPDAHAVTLSAVTNGTLTATVDDAAITSGDDVDMCKTVTIAATPNSGYKLKSLTVTDEDDEEVEVTNNQFVMPAKNVTIAAVFEETKTLTGITLTGEYPTVFLTGDAFSHEGMTVTANYDDETSANVTDEATLTGYNMSAAGVQTVTVSYTEGATVTKTYDITVKDAYTVTEILPLVPAQNAGSLATKVKGYISQIDQYNSSYNSITYWISDDGKTTSDQLEVYSGKNVGNTNFYSIDDLEVGDFVTITGNVKTHTNGVKEFDKNNYIITGGRIQKGAVTSVAVSGNATKTTYSANETFETAGLVVTATYANGFSEVVTEGITWGDNLTDHKVAESTTVQVTATVGGVISAAYGVAIEVSTKALVSIALSADEFEVYQGLELPKPTVTATYSEGEPEDVTALADFTGYDKTTPGEQIITVSYSFGGNDDSKTYTVTVKPIYNVELAASVARDLIINSVGSAGSGANKMIIRGIVVNPSNPSSSKQTYYISDDGSNTNTVEIFKGLYIDGANFTASNKLIAGDEVVVKGAVTYYQSSTPEFSEGSILQSLARTPNFEIEAVTGFEVGSANLAVGDLTITQDGEGAVTLASSNNTDAVTIVDGNLHAVAAGTATITANLAADGIYKAATYEFSVTVIPAQIKYAITFDGNGNTGGSAPEAIADKAAGEEVTLPANSYTKTGYTFTGWKVYDENEDEVTVTANAFTMPASPVTIKAQWAALPIWATTYSSNITVGTDIVKFSDELEAPEYAAKKTGTGSAYGSTTVTVPVSTSKLHFHAVCYGADTYAVTLKVKKGDNVLGTFNINKDTGAKGSSPFILANTPYEQYYSVTLADITEPTTITFEAESGSENGKRFIIFGVNQEGGLVPVLDHIEIAGDLTTKSGYKAGDAIDMDGLTVSATYTLGGTPQTPVDITEDVALEWSYDPLVEGQENVTITASYKGQTDDIEITLDEPVASADPVIYVQPSLNVNFGTVAKDASVDAKTITITLQNVAAATATLGGTNPEAFNIDKTALVNGDVITISVASTATLGSYSATITITDNAGLAPQKVVNLSLNVEDVETPVSTTSEWIAATEIVNGMQVLIVGERNEKIYAVGAQTSNNRTAVEGSLSEGVFTPGENTMAFTVVAQEGDTYALQASNGKYLYAAGFGSGKNYLRSQDEVDDNAKWTLSVSSATANGTNTNNKLQLNNSSDIFSCYSSTQKAIRFYVPKPAPAPEYEAVRTELTPNAYYTMCLEKAVTNVRGGSIWKVISKSDDTENPGIILEEVDGTLDAGRPYIFFATADKLEVVYEGAAVGAPITTGNNGLVGSFDQVKITANAANYIIYNNELYYVNSNNVYVGEHRAYLNMEAVPPYSNEPQQGNAPRRRVTMAVHGPQVATGMEGVQPSEISNQKVLINGQLFILRGEKMYDATGRLVK